MAAKSPSSLLRARLREKIRSRIEQLQMKDAKAASKIGFSPSQMSKLRADLDIFSLDRLVDAGARLGITVQMAGRTSRRD